MLVPALFWSTFSFTTFSYLIFRGLVPLHLAIEPASAQAIWGFFLDPNHPARMASVGFIELLIGWLCFEHFRRNNLEHAVLAPGRFSASSIAWTIGGALILPELFGYMLEPIFRGSGDGPAEVFKDGASTLFPMTQLLAFFVVAVFIAPVIEEFLFRGAFLTTALASGWSAPLAVLVSSAGFAFIHGQYTPFGLTIIFAMGLGLGGLRVWSGGLVLPMIAHAAINLKAVTFSFLSALQP